MSEWAYNMYAIVVSARDNSTSLRGVDSLSLNEALGCNIGRYTAVQYKGNRVYCSL
jgi:hypothetical protein